MTMTLSGDGTITGLVAGGLPNATVTADDLASGAAVSNIGYTPANQQAENINFRNRIINGDMRIDQRNAGASVTPADNAYTLDRWQSRLSQASKYSVQRSSTAPSGFNNSLLVTSLSAYTVGASEFFQVRQIIEGFNIADLGFGTASAKTITLSFWVRSSLTGTFGGVLSNSIGDRVYVFSYSISVADTWEQKTITITGDTTGTWETITGGGFVVAWSLGAGASVSGSAGSWGSTLFRGVTSGTSVVGTNGATFYLTGVQLEVGSVATPFERRPYGTELQLCERYYQKTVGFNTATGTGTTQCGAAVMFKTEMRSSPTPSLTAPLQITRFGVSDFTQSSADVVIAGSGTRVNTLAISLNFGNFTSLPTDTCLPVIVTGGILALSAEL